MLKKCTPCADERQATENGVLYSPNAMSSQGLFEFSEAMVFAHL
jgi:hypothetical protein